MQLGDEVEIIPAPGYKASGSYFILQMDGDKVMLIENNTKKIRGTVQVPMDMIRPVAGVQEALTEITDEQYQALFNYSTKNYGPLNQYLRSGAIRQGYTVESLEEYKMGVAAVLKNSEKFVGTSYRGMAFRTESDYNSFVNQTKPGAVIMDKSFMSTSTDSSVAQAFADDTNLTRKKVIFTIKGKSGVDISNLTASTDEDEVLFPMNTKFKVISTKDKTTQSGDYLYVILQEL